MKNQLRINLMLVELLRRSQLRVNLMLVELLMMNHLRVNLMINQLILNQICQNQNKITDLYLID